MGKIFYYITLLILLPSIAFALPAFPGAEGMGADTVGGRGGTVYIVSNLNDTGAGSFRAACEASGPRYVTFTVSGVIDSVTPIIITNPYITIAGETSPGGIVISSSQTNINTYNVIVRHMRFRLGATRVTSGNAEQIGDAVEIGAYSEIITDPVQYNIIFDHCSFSWGVDETVSAVCNTSDVTFSYCSFTSGLYLSVHPESPHSAGFIAWAKFAQNMRISIHHSFFGYNMFRNPENNYQSFIDGVNNVGYGHETTRTWEVTNVVDYTATANAIGCYTKTDLSTSYGRTIYIIQYTTPTPSPIIYMTGCLDGSRTSQSDPQWSVQEYFHDALASTDFRTETPYSTLGFSGTGIPVTATVMSEAYASTIVGNAGATKPVQDGVDITAVANYEAGTGGFTNSADVDTIIEIEALVNLSSPAAPTDSNSNGIADDWEVATFGGLVSATDDYFGQGYNNIEYYLHYKTGYVPPTIPTVTLQDDFSVASAPTSYTGSFTVESGRTGTLPVSSNGFTVVCDDGDCTDEETEAFTVTVTSVPVTDTITVTDSSLEAGQDSITISVLSKIASGVIMSGVNIQ